MRAWKQAAIGMLFFAPSLTLAEFNDPPMSISEYQKQEWHVEDGLPQSNVRAIIQASNRQLLIGERDLCGQPGRIMAGDLPGIVAVSNGRSRKE